jgi:tRNA dimethylallyltransferase
MESQDKFLSLPPNLLVILGPTASGKTAVAVQVARDLDGEIISADSRQVYRGMDIGTGKDLREYGTISYHLMNIVDPGDAFNVFEFQRRFWEVFQDIRERGKIPLLVGGTGLYLEAVLKKYRMFEVPENPELRRALSSFSLPSLVDLLQTLQPTLHNITDLLDRRRLIRAIEIAKFQKEVDPRSSSLPTLSPLVFGIRWERKILRRRITDRLRKRLQEGMIEEVQALLQSGISHETLDFYGLEYRFVSQYLRGEIKFNDMFQRLNSAIHQFAKRQETWFRRMERGGIQIHWVEGAKEPAAAILHEIRESFHIP